MNPYQLKEHIIAPALEVLGLRSPEAEVLLLATAAIESNCGKYVQQVKGPAMGIFQMEPETHNDIWINYLGYRTKLGSRVRDLTMMRNWPPVTQLRVNPIYAAAMARLQYYRVPEPLPGIDKWDMWHYYKKYYNTPLGKSDPTTWAEKWTKYVEPVIKGVH